jgi:hypothetical protein
VNDSVRFQFGPLDRSGVVLGLRLGQLAILASGGALGIVLLLGSHGSLLAGGLAVVGAVLAIAMALLPIGGRGLDEWIPVLLRRRSISPVWRSTASTTGLVVTLAGDILEPRGANPPALHGVHLLSVDVGDGTVGMVKDTARGAYVGVLRVSGSSYALLSDREKAVQLSAWGSALSSLAYHGSPVSAVQLVVRNVAEDPDGLARYLDEAGTVDRDTSIFRSYLGLVEAAAPVTQTQEVLVALAISTRRAGRAIAAAGGHDQGAAIVLLRTLSQLQSQLTRAQIRVEGVLPPRLLAETYRQAWDPLASQPLSRRAATDPANAGVALSGAGPQSTLSAWRHLVTDGGCAHATYWISEWPRIDVGPNFLVPLLLQSTARLTFSVTMAPVDPGRAQRDLEAAQTAHISDEMLRSKHGFRTSIRSHRQAEAIEQREREFADGHADYRFSGYLTVTAVSVDTLDAACGEVELQARNCRLDLRRMDGEHDLAFTYTLPLGRGLA